MYWCCPSVCPLRHVIIILRGVFDLEALSLSDLQPNYIIEKIEY